MKKNTVLIVVLLVLAAFGIGYTLSRDNSTDKSTNTPTASSIKGKTLDLSGKQLTELSADITNQTDVISLNLANNQLTTLPAAIANMKNLEVLNVENNRLETLRPEIGQLKNLLTADFSNNRLTSLPSELGNLTQLKTLNLGSYKGSPRDIDQLKAKLPDTDIKR